MFVIFHWAKVREEQNTCAVGERKGELSGYEHMKKNGCGSKILSFIKNPFPKLSIYPSQSEQRMSLMTVIYQLATF